MAPFVMHLWPTGIEYSTAVTTTTGLVTDAVIDLPSSLNGKLAVILVRSGRSPVEFTTPSGWTNLIQTSTTARMALFYRVCDGSEGATVTISQTSDGSTATTGRVSAIAWRVSGVATTETAFIEAAQASDSANPPSLTPSWGSAENSWLAVYSSRYSDWSVSAYPTNYVAHASVFDGTSSSVDNVGIAVGERTLTATTEDPGAFTITEVTTPLSGVRTLTVALRPAV